MLVKYRVKVVQDSGAGDPREDDNLGTMVCQHHNHTLGDDQFKWSFTALLMELLRKAGAEERADEINAEHSALYTANNNDSAWSSPYWRDTGWHQRETEIDKLELNAFHDELSKHYYWKPLYLYDHGGITMNTTGFSCRWDSGCVGIIYLSKKKAEDEWATESEDERAKLADQCLVGEVEVYSQYLEGDVYGFVIEQWDGFDWVSEDSCWGFYGDDTAENGMQEHVSETLWAALAQAATRHDSWVECAVETPVTSEDIIKAADVMADAATQLVGGSGPSGQALPADVYQLAERARHLALALHAYTEHRRGAPGV